MIITLAVATLFLSTSSVQADKIHRAHHDKRSLRERMKGKESMKQSLDDPLSVLTLPKPKSKQARKTQGMKTYIVVLNDEDIEDLDVNSVAHEFSTRFGDRGMQRMFHGYTIMGFSMDLSEEELELCKQDERVLYVSEDAEVFADPMLEGAFNNGDNAARMDFVVASADMNRALQQKPTGVRRVGADKITFWQGNDNITVGVLDTGIFPHSELNIAQEISCFTDYSSCNDGNNHGTHVAGTIAGFSTGVAPNALVVPIKVLSDSGSGSIGGVIKGIDHCVEHNINVINMSLGGRGDNDAFRMAVDRAVEKGIVVVVAAGNNGSNAGDFMPSRFPKAFAVSAVADYDGRPGGLSSRSSRGEDDHLASFSNFGSAVDIAAPGVEISSTLPGDRKGNLSGTSMAAPHVAGAVVLAMDRLGFVPTDEAGVNTIRNFITSNGDDSFTDRTNDPKENMLNVFAMEL